MANKMKPVLTDKNDQIFKWSSVTLAILGALDAIYLLVLKYTQAVAMCIGNHGCITVNNSSYSEIYHTPVAFFGLMGYVSIAALLIIEPKWNLTREQGPLVVFGAALIGVLFSAYLTYIEYYVIYAVCPFCLASAIIITIIFILAIIRLVKQTAL